MSIALANSGDVQLELIQQRNDVPSLYRDFLAAGHEGMQHWSSWPENYHEIRDRALKSGWEIGQEGDTPRGPFIYFLNEGHPGTVVEMAEATPTRMRIFDQVREAAIGWDGSDPIRHELAAGVKAGVKAAQDQHSACLCCGAEVAECCARGRSRGERQRTGERRWTSTARLPS